jgi:hypothetical protein
MMIKDKLRELIVSWLHQDRKESAMVLLVKKKSTKTSIEGSSDCLKKLSKRGKMRKQQPLCKVISNIVRRMVRLLTIDLRL